MTSGLIVWPKVIGAHVKEQLPFMATENILMECVKAGGDRQELHEAIRVHSMEAARVYKEEGVWWCVWLVILAAVEVWVCGWAEA